MMEKRLRARNVLDSERPPCSIEGCNKLQRYLTRKLCHTHYEHQRRTPTYRNKQICKAPDCIETTSTKNPYCLIHRERAKRGEPLDRRISTKGERNGNWKGGVADYTNHYDMKKARLLKLEQVGAKCEECGKRKPKEKLMVHHLDGSKDNHDLDNFKLVCHKCHISVYHAKRFNGLTVKEIAVKVGCSLGIVYACINNKHPSSKYASAVATIIK
jgi:hypothetical protein